MFAIERDGRVFHAMCDLIYAARITGCDIVPAPNSILGDCACNRDIHDEARYFLERDIRVGLDMSGTIDHTKDTEDSEDCWDDVDVYFYTRAVDHLFPPKPDFFTLSDDNERIRAAMKGFGVANYDEIHIGWRMIECVTINWTPEDHDKSISIWGNYHNSALGCL